MRTATPATVLVAAVLGIAAAAAPPARAGDEQPTPAAPQGPERDALFAWLDGLGLPDVTRGDVVAVTRHGETEPGFVTGREGDTTYVATLSLHEPAVRPLPADAPDWQRVTIAPLDLADAVRDILAATARKRAEDRAWIPAMGGDLPDRARLVVLARACAARGLVAETEALLAEASIVPGSRDWHGADTTLSLQERVEDDLEHAFHVRVFASPTVMDPFRWRDAYRRFAQRFPLGRHAPEARRLASIVDRMIAESPRVPSEEEALALAGDARARALCLRLRTMEHVTPSVNGGPSSVFAAEWGEPPSAADHLLAMGADAIPALVAFCDDETLTGISHTGRGDWNPGVLTVGDCALSVLERLAPDAGHTAAQVKTWWLRRSAPAEAVLLIDRIVARDEPLAAARELAARHPDLALWPLVLGGEMHPEDLADVAAGNAWIDLLAALPDPRVPAHLARRARRGGRLSARVGAIEALLARDEEQALLLAMHTAEFLHEESHATPDRGGGGRLADLVRVESEAAGRLVELLAAHGWTEVLARRFARQWPHLREMTVRAVVRHADDVSSGDALAVLLAALADGTPLEDRHAIARAAGVATPRVKDAAALALHARNAELFAFTPGADRATRDAEIAVIVRTLARE